MNATVSRSRKRVGKYYLTWVAKRLLQWHLPVGAVNRPFFSALYRFHVAARVAAGWSLRVLWYEPLWRSQCRLVGKRFRMEQLPYLLGRGEIVIGNDVCFSGKPSFTFSSRCTPLPQLSIGNGSFLGHNCALTIAKQVQIGDHCLIAGGVRITDFDGHPLDAHERRAGGTFAADSVRPVIIGNDVWIGHGAVILKGVHVGDRVVIGACAVVTHSVPADTVVAGNPARVIKRMVQEHLQST
jgi:acetyltransferase-like isoleucine patch superfamily enzyme